MLTSVFPWLGAASPRNGAGRIAGQRPRRLRAVRRQSYVPRLDLLEDRSLPSTFTVTNLLDSGNGSLRQAILDANSTSQDNTILFAVAGTISLARALPVLNTDINVKGPGPDRLTVQGSGADETSEFSVFTISSAATVILSGLTISNGSATLGGGIFNDGGILAVSDCILTGNSALRGGGITNFGSLIVSYSTIAGNTAISKGGGIANFGPLAVSYSTLSGNSASTGGAIYSFDGAVLTVSNSTLAGNSADFGGGLAMNGGMATVTNSTLASNSAAYDGGGIENDFGATLTIANSTISGNSGPEGGGILNDGTVTSRDSILAGNTGIDGLDIAGIIDSQGHNLIGDPSGCTGLDPSDLVGVDPLLGPLQDNGGPTWTMALLPSSPAIGAGDTSDDPDWDQRGEGFPRIVNGLIDIGAFEVQSGGSSRPEAPVSSRGRPIPVAAATLLLWAIAPSPTWRPNTPDDATHAVLDVRGIPGGSSDLEARIFAENDITVILQSIPIVTNQAGGHRGSDQTGQGLGGVYRTTAATVTAATDTTMAGDQLSTSNADMSVG